MRRAGRSRRRLHRRLFWWFGASILFSVVCSVLTFGWVFREQWGDRQARISELVSERFAPVWDDPVKRQLLLHQVADTFDARLTLRDAQSNTLVSAGGACEKTHRRAAVKHGQKLLGYVAYCGPRRAHRVGLGLVLVFFLGGGLWVASLTVARRITRPLSALAAVTKKIGAGDHSARAQIGSKHRDEVSELAESINEMAAQIEKQMRDQRELLAAVSHEIRTPLGHLRVVSELLERDGVTAARREQLERELQAIDQLVAELLANSRLEFGALEMRRLEAATFTRELLSRGSYGRSEGSAESAVLVDETANIEFFADPSLLVRALDNLLQNAEKHGGGISQVKLRTDREAGEPRLVFSVVDHGPGFRPEEVEHVFDAFFRGRGGAGEGASLGLGLSLVRRIAEAHGGTAWTETGTDSGATVCFSVSLKASDS